MHICDRKQRLSTVEHTKFLLKAVGHAPYVIRRLVSAWFRNQFSVATEFISRSSSCVVRNNADANAPAIYNGERDPREEKKENDLDRDITNRKTNRCFVVQSPRHIFLATKNAHTSAYAKRTFSFPVSSRRRKRKPSRSFHRAQKNESVALDFQRHRGSFHFHLQIDRESRHRHNNWIW